MTTPVASFPVPFISQKGQDRWIIEEVFPGKRGGWFVDLAASDGVNINNTLLLERHLGWTGVAIEADPEFFPKLRAARTCRCVHACVDAGEGEIEFLQNGKLGGIVADDTDNRPAARTELIRKSREDGRVLPMTTRTLASILDEANAPAIIDYLSLDVEGAETRILGPFPFDRYRFMAMTIERPTPEINTQLFAAGYVFIRNVRFDTFYVHGSLPDLDRLRPEPFEQIPPKDW